MNQNNEQKNNNYPNTFIQAAVNILSLSSRLEHVMSRVLKPFSLTFPQFNVLRILSTNYPNPVVLKKVTEQMIDKSSNTSRLIDKLSEKQLTVRQVAPNDRRVIHIVMTERGLTLVNEVKEALESHLENHFLPHEKNETTELVETLKILRGYE